MKETFLFPPDYFASVYWNFTPLVSVGNEYALKNDTSSHHIFVTWIDLFLFIAWHLFLHFSFKICFVTIPYGKGMDG